MPERMTLEMSNANKTFNMGRTTDSEKEYKFLGFN